MSEVRELVTTPGIEAAAGAKSRTFNPDWSLGPRNESTKYNKIKCFAEEAYP